MLHAVNSMIFRTFANMKTSDFPYRLIAVDADDTLWDCQSHFEVVERQYAALLHDFADEETVAEELFATECQNMEDLGFGVKAFIISLCETAIRISKGKIEADRLTKIINLGRSLLTFPTNPLPEVRDTLSQLQQQAGMKDYRLVVFTKGELQDQENKLRRSGLWNFFDDVIIVADKNPEAYRHLCDQFSIEPHELLMIGNSYKSDCAPALAIGAYALHIPYHVMWRMEETKEESHPRLRKIKHFSEILQLL